MAPRRRVLKTISGKRLLTLKPWLDDLAERIEQPAYIDKDPVCFMHAFQDKNDREIAGFLAAIMAWGRRDIVIRKVDELLTRMDYQPAAFTSNYTEADSGRFSDFRHRTFTGTDVHWLILCMRDILHRYGSVEGVWLDARNAAGNAGPEMITAFHNRFFGEDFAGPHRVRKHISTGEKMSSCKRIWLYLRWCIRKNSVVDPGTMNFISPSDLMIPLDVHVARHARRLGLLQRQTNDWMAVNELTTRLRQLDPADPARYDYSLFGVGISEESVPPEFVVNAWYK